MEDGSENSDTGRFAQIPVWLIPLVSARSLQVYSVLAAHADWTTKECWPSYSYMAKELKTTDRTIKRAVEELVEAGALLKTNRKTEKGGYTSNIYKLIRQKNSNLVTSVSPPLVSHVSPPSDKDVTSPSDTNVPLTITNLTITNEQDIMPEQSSSEETQVLVTTSKSKHSKPKSKLVAVKELSYEPIGKIKPQGSQWPDLFQAVLDACTMDAKELTKSASGEIGAACKQIWDAGGRAEHIALRAECYKLLFNKTVVTPSALAKHWPKCTPAKVEEDIASSPERQRLLDQYSNLNRFAHLEQKAISQ